ncbi:MAG: isopentenyl phosphate kinase [Patescibacteria group bacterium]
MSLYILKLGGSIITNKETSEFSVQKERITNIAKHLHKALKKQEDMQLIIIHGAGGPGHHLAHKYNLRDGTGSDSKRLHGALLSRLVNQKLNTEIFDIFANNNVPVIPTHTGSLITQTDKKITTFHTDIIKSALNNNYIPLIYGDMVFDDSLGLSICSGDTSAAYLAKNLPVNKVLFATDTDGIFNKDPHKNADAKLLENLSLKDIFTQDNIKLDSSHNTDVTDGIKGKLHAFEDFSKKQTTLEEIIVFNGTTPQKFEDVLNNVNCKATYIKTN